MNKTSKRITKNNYIMKITKSQQKVCSGVFVELDQSCSSVRWCDS